MQPNPPRHQPGRWIPAEAALVDLLHDTDTDVRSAAAWALHGTSNPAALVALVDLLHDDTSDVRSAAAWALHGTSNPAALAALVDTWAARNDAVAEDAAMRHAAARSAWRLLIGVDGASHDRRCAVARLSRQLETSL